MSLPRLSLFAATGVELEYMIVAAGSLDVQPIGDELIHAVTGAYQSDVDRGTFCWSNELVRHVLEIKTNEPAPTLWGLAGGFQTEVQAINQRLAALGARLMPAAMHPWMDPRRETQLWPHEYHEVYAAYHRIFDCYRHGWANLQSLHLNLPFANDAEFGQLHAAVRALLPLLPALAASSPLKEGRLTGWLDQRLVEYRTNSERIPSLTGQVIPEPLYTQADYDREVFQRIYRDIAPHDPAGWLQDEFLNARGAIARFGRGSLEIRLLDMQECPLADLALAQLVVATLRALVQERWQPLDRLQSLPTDRLATLLLTTMRDAEEATITDPDLLGALGWRTTTASASDLWRHLAEQLGVWNQLSPEESAMLRHIFEQGSLARRILRATGPSPTPQRLRTVYGQLCDCLANGVAFAPTHSPLS